MDKNKEMETNKNQEMVSEDKGSKLFRKAFYDEAREIEARAEKVDLEIDEDRMEVMYQRIMAKTAGQEKPDGEDIPDETADPATEAVRDKTVDIQEESMAHDTSGRMTVHAKKPWKSTLRWVAVLALVCAGVFGVSLQSQAGKDGLWSSIQWLIGVESRWEQKDNSAEREYTDPEEWAAVVKIKDAMEGSVPTFYYWPDNIKFSEYKIDKETNAFTMVYQSDVAVVFFEGWYNDASDASVMSSWENEGKVSYQEYDGIKYKIVETEDENNVGKTYYVEWNVNNARFLLSGLDDMLEIEKILKNIKN